MRVLWVSITPPRPAWMTASWTFFFSFLQRGGQAVGDRPDPDTDVSARDHHRCSRIWWEILRLPIGMEALFCRSEPLVSINRLMILLITNVPVFNEHPGQQMRHVWSPLRAAEQPHIVTIQNDLAAFWLFELLWFRCLRGRRSKDAFTYGCLQFEDFYTLLSHHLFTCWWGVCRGVTFKKKLVCCPPPPPSLRFIVVPSSSQIWPLLTPEMEDCGERNDISIQGGSALWNKLSMWVWVHSSFMFQSRCTFPKAFIEIIKSVTSVLLDSRRVLKKTLQWLLANGNVIRKMLNMYIHNVLFYEGTSTMTTAHCWTSNH